MNPQLQLLALSPPQKLGEESIGVGKGTSFVACFFFLPLAFFSFSCTDILLAVVDEIFEEIFALFVVPDGTPPMKHLRMIADRHSRLMADDSRSFARPWLEIVAAAPRMGLRQRAVEKQLTAAAALTRIATAGQRAGEIRPEIDPEHLAWQFLSWAWGENVGSTIGLTDFIQHGHSSRMIHRMLDEVATPARLSTKSRQE
jgi:hypothetical protein